MPLPFFLVAGLATIVGGAGIKKSIDAYDDNKEAQKVNSRAQSIVTQATDDANQARNRCYKAISALGGQKISVLDGSVAQFLQTFAKLKNVDFRASDGLNELANLKISNNSLKQLKEMKDLSDAATGGALSGLAGGALAGWGAYGATTLLASASTGTAISTLSGVAASNATLAWLGGGTLAAGGFGVAGGMAILGGLVAAPALAVFGFVMSAEAAAKKQEAYANLEQAKAYAEDMKLAKTLCNGIQKRAELFSGLLHTLDNYLDYLDSQMLNILRNSGTDYSKFSIDEKKVIAETTSIALAVKSILDTPILTSDGELTHESEIKGNELKELVYEKHRSGEIKEVYIH